jgi:hypothetical protein
MRSIAIAVLEGNNGRKREGEIRMRWTAEGLGRICNIPANRRRWKMRDEEGKHRCPEGISFAIMAGA